MFRHFTFCVQSNILFFLAELFWFKSCSIFILQLGLAPYFTVAIIDMVSGSTTATLHYKLAIILSVLDPPFTLMCSVYYIARVGFSFILFEPLSYIFFQALIGISLIGSIIFKQWKLIFSVFPPISRPSRKCMLLN